jgi:hypothetical protein
MDESDEEKAFEVRSGGSVPVGPGRASFDPSRLDFGHYAGRSIAELVDADPEYLRWLARHPSGVRYRAEIHRALGRVPLSTDWER